MKKIFSILLSVIFMISLCSVKVNAQEISSQKEIVAVLISDGNTYYFNQQELDEFKKQNTITDPFAELNIANSSASNTTAPRNAGLWTIIKNKVVGSSFLSYARSTKVTPSVKGPATLSHGSSVSFSFTCNFALSLSDKTSIGGSWSADSSSSFSMSFNVPANKTGYVQFTPYYRPVSADRLTYVDATLIKTERLNILQPVKVGSSADGLYELKL